MQTCVLCVCQGEMHGCDAPPPNSVSPNPPQCSVDSPVYVQLSVISPSSPCQAPLPVVSVPRHFVGFCSWTFGDHMVCSTSSKDLEHCSAKVLAVVTGLLEGMVHLWDILISIPKDVKVIVTCSWPLELVGFVPGLCSFYLVC